MIRLKTENQVCPQRSPPDLNAAMPCVWPLCARLSFFRIFLKFTLLSGGEFVYNYYCTLAAVLGCYCFSDSRFSSVLAILFFVDSTGVTCFDQLRLFFRVWVCCL